MIMFLSLLINWDHTIQVIYDLNLTSLEVVRFVSAYNETHDVLQPLASVKALLMKLCGGLEEIILKSVDGRHTVRSGIYPTIVGTLNIPFHLGYPVTSLHNNIAVVFIAAS